MRLVAMAADRLRRSAHGVYAARQMVPFPSSVTGRDPSSATATLTGLAQTFPSPKTKPTRKSSYSPVGLEGRPMSIHVESLNVRV